MLTFDANTVRCENMAFKIPRYHDVREHIHNLTQKKRLLQRQYMRHTCEIINEMKVDPKQFDQIVDEIHLIDEAIDVALSTAYVSENQSLKDHTEYKSKMEEILNAKQSNDKTVASRLSLLYQARIKNDTKYEPKEYIKQPPLLEGEYTQTTSKHLKQPTIVPVQPKPKKKIVPPPPKVPSPKPLSPKEKKEVVESIKDLLKQSFQFQTHQECTSKARTKPFFVSKDDILKIIEENEKLKKLMPANYKKLTKDQLCEIFFKD